MAKGGARARSGPAPDPLALRRDRRSDADGWVVLPAAGRAGKAPKWPLAAPSVLVDGEDKVLEAVQARELALWALEWRRPQAVMWERNGQELEVALYVRSVVTAERADAPTNARTLVRQQQEALGISIPGLMRNKWRIEPVADASARAPVARGSSVRDKLKVVAGGAA